MRYTAKINDRTFNIDVGEGPDRLVLAIDGKPVEADWEWLGHDRDMSLLLDGRSYDIKIEPDNGRLFIYYGGERFECLIEDVRLAELRRLAGEEVAAAGLAEIKAPMPGLILKVFVKPGQEVNKGERLLIIEAMKMENELRAPRDGTVKAINCREQQAVEQAKVLLILE